MHTYSKIICPRPTTNREFKKLRWQLRRKLVIKTELCVKFSVLRLFHVGHVEQNRRGALSLASQEWFSCKGKEWKIYCYGLALSSELQIWKFHVVVWQTTSKNCTKKRPARAARLFSSFNQTNHWLVALTLPLPSSFLKLPIVIDTQRFPCIVVVVTRKWRTLPTPPLSQRSIQSYSFTDHVIQLCVLHK